MRKFGAQAAREVMRLIDDENTEPVAKLVEVARDMSQDGRAGALASCLERFEETARATLERHREMFPEHDSER